MEFPWEKVMAIFCDMFWMVFVKKHAKLVLPNTSIRLEAKQGIELKRLIMLG